MNPIDQLVSRACGFAAFAIPVAIGILAASPEPYWLDSPELTAAAQTLGIPHPPGHPLYVMLSKPFTLLPFGGIPFRVALASTVFGALSSYILYKLIYRIIETAVSHSPVWIRALTACSSALIVSVTPGWWFQCVRAEVYALQILLVLGALYPLVVFCLEFDRGDHRLLYLSAFIAGLGLSNHHFIMMAALPAAIPPLVWETKRRGGFAVVKLTGRLAAVGLSALAPYLFLPIRSASGESLLLGGVHSVKDFFWVVSAQVYQKSMAKEHAFAFGERTLDTLFSMMNEIGPFVLLAAGAGFYFLLRRPSTRMVGVVTILMISVSVLLRSVMGFDHFNPDYYGYMMPVMAGIAVGFGVFCALVLDIVKVGFPRGAIVSPLLVIALVALPVLRARQARSQVDLSHFTATRLMLDLTLHNAPPGTLILSSYYKLFFVLWSAQFIDGSRPDVVTINPHFFDYPGYLNSMLIKYPKLAPLARAMIVEGRLTETTVADLAWNGPLRIDPDPSLGDDVIRYMLPDGPAYITSPEPLSLADVAAASPRHLRRWRAFYNNIGPAWREHETWRMLSWCHYQDAIFMARRGDRAGARQTIEMALAINNEAWQLSALLEAVNDGDSGPLDVTRFLPFASKPIPE